MLILASPPFEVLSFIFTESFRLASAGSELLSSDGAVAEYQVSNAASCSLCGNGRFMLKAIKLASERAATKINRGDKRVSFFIPRMIDGGVGRVKWDNSLIIHIYRVV